jgi:hypothetical protein
MVGKHVWLVGLGAALAGPYLLLDGNLPNALKSSRDQWLGSTSGQPVDDAWLAQLDQTATWQEPAGDPFSATTVNLGEAIRADVRPEWVLSRWPKVATVVGELDWAGMRVPLVSGFQEHDVVGSLTYYFDRQQRLRRISLDGYTGDERPLAFLAREQFNLQAQSSLSAGLYVSRWNGEPMSVLAVEYAPVVSSDLPQVRRRILLEINLPEPGWRVSPEGLAAIGVQPPESLVKP